jgi:subtilisin family serine protease
VKIRLALLFIAILISFNQAAGSQNSDLSVALVNNIIEIGTVGTVRKTFGSLILQFPETVNFWATEETKNPEPVGVGAGGLVSAPQRLLELCIANLNISTTDANNNSEEYTSSDVILDVSDERQLFISFKENQLKPLKQGTFSLTITGEIDYRCIKSSGRANVGFGLFPSEKLHVLDLRENSDYTLVLHVDSLNPGFLDPKEYPDDHPIRNLLSQLLGRDNPILNSIVQFSGDESLRDSSLNIQSKAFRKVELPEAHHGVEQCNGGLIEFTPSLLEGGAYQPGTFVNFSPSFANAEFFGIDPRAKGGIGSSVQGVEGEPVNNDIYRALMGLDADFDIRGDEIIIAVLDTGVTKEIFDKYDKYDSRLLEGASFVRQYASRFDLCDPEGNCTESLIYRVIRDRNNPEENQSFEGIGTVRHQSDNYDNYGTCDTNVGCVTYDHFDNPAHAPFPYEFGHGTAVALLAAGGVADESTSDPVGIAPGAKILPVQVCDANGDCSLIDVIQGLCYALNEAYEANKQRLKREPLPGQQFNNLVINLSLSFSGEFQAPLLEKILTEATKQGAIIVASAGDVSDGTQEACLEERNRDILENVKNEWHFIDIMEKYNSCKDDPQPNIYSDFFPAAITDSNSTNQQNNTSNTNGKNDIDGMITVGALTYKDAQFSKWKYTPSKNVDVYAPGCVAINGLYLEFSCGEKIRIFGNHESFSKYGLNCYEDKSDKNYFFCDNSASNPLNGASFATGLISGVAALYRDKCPNATSGEIEDMIRFYGKEINNPPNNNKSIIDGFIGFPSSDLYMDDYVIIPNLTILQSIDCPDMPESERQNAQD